MKKFFVLVALAAMVACSGSKTAPVTPKSGNISFSPIESNSASSANKLASADVVRASVASTVFSFGNIPSTQTYLFQLTNTGTAAVNNVTVSTDNPTVAICTPSSIGVLPIQGTGGITPLLEVQVLHGRGLNNYGVAPCLPAGAFVFHLTASGTDTSGNTVTATCEIDLNVLVASFTILDYTGTVLTAPINASEPVYGLPLPFPIGGWDIYTATSGISNAFYSIVNNGNVSLSVNDLGSYDGTNSPINQSFTVLPGATQMITMKYTTIPNNNCLMDPLLIGSGNVMFNNVIPSNIDGSYYMFYRFYKQ